MPTNRKARLFDAESWSFRLGKHVSPTRKAYLSEWVSIDIGFWDLSLPLQTNCSMPSERDRFGVSALCPNEGIIWLFDLLKACFIPLQHLTPSSAQSLWQNRRC